MPDTFEHSVTAALDAIRNGECDAKEALIASIYDHLRRLAYLRMRGRMAGHTLQPTALVNEALMPFLNTDVLVDHADRKELVGAVSVAMKNVLIDHYRAKRRYKRGGDRTRELHELDKLRAADASPSTDAAPGSNDPDVLDRMLAWFHEQGFDIEHLDEALDDLRRVDERWFFVCMLRFFAGYTHELTAATLGVSLRTAKDDWKQAKAWLRVRLGEVDGLHHTKGA